MQTSFVQQSNYPLEGLKLAFIQLTMIMIGVCLLVDAVNGFFLAGLGVDAKLSAMFKLVLLLLALYQLGAYNIKALAATFFSICFLMIGPLLGVIESYDASAFFVDLISLLKIMTAFIIYAYCTELARRRPELLLKYGRACLNFSLLVFFINISLGVLGYGFSSYGSGEEGDDSNIGIKGFFYAGNEVSGIFIILFTAFLHQAWQKSNIVYYLAAALISVVAGLLIATKAAMLAGVVIAAMIPIINERNRVFNLTWLKVKLSTPLAIVIVFLFLFIVPILDSTGVLDRFIWFYEKKGLIGILLSGRDEFIADTLIIFQYTANFADYLFGIGRLELSIVTKESVEVDPIDLYMWYGIPGLMFFLFVSFVFLISSYKCMKLKASKWGPAVFIVNLLLVAVSFIAGHIVTSGMIGPLWGLINGMAYADYLIQRRLYRNE